MFLHLSVILFTWGGDLPLGLGGVCLWFQGCTPQGRHPTRQTHTPPGQTPRLGTTLPPADTPTPETATAADGTHPTGMHSCYCMSKQ